MAWQTHFFVNVFFGAKIGSINDSSGKVKVQTKTCYIIIPICYHQQQHRRDLFKIPHTPLLCGYSLHIKYKYRSLRVYVILHCNQHARLVFFFILVASSFTLLKLTKNGLLILNLYAGPEIMTSLGCLKQHLWYSIFNKSRYFDMHLS